MPHATISAVVRTLIAARQQGRAAATLVAVCPNSVAVLEAAVKVAAENNAPMLFAATLNQVDRDGGYTGWTPSQFVSQMRLFGAQYGWRGPLYPCLDHGGPWLNDRHTRDGLSLAQTTSEVKSTLTACLEAGYQLLHIDPTVDRTLPPGQPPAVETVVARTTDLIAHSEAQRLRLGLPPVAYEVGSEEVHGGLADLANFEAYLHGLRAALAEQRMEHAWPCFIVAQVGTDLHTTSFSASAARRLTEIVAPMGSLLKGHYTDWVDNPQDYPATGMGAANVGPEFTAAEFLALQDLTNKEASLARNRGLQPSAFMDALEQAVIASGRWQKWLLPDERGRSFAELSPERRGWLARTGARYVWTAPGVLAARARLYENLKPVVRDAHAYVVARIAGVMDRYINAFGLFDSLTLFGQMEKK